MVSAIQSRKAELARIPSTWLSEDFLKRCLERREGLDKGSISSYRDQWGRKGKREVRIFYISAPFVQKGYPLTDTWSLKIKHFFQFFFATYFFLNQGQRGPSETWWYPPRFLTKELNIAVISNRYGTLYTIYIGKNILIPSKSVVFRERWGKNELMKGIDVTGPPSLPRHFVVKKGCMEDVDVGSDSEEDEDENSELNTGMLLDIDSDNVEDHGDN